MTVNALNLFKNRGYFFQCTDEIALSNLLEKKKINFYIGFDCTAKSLHVGSLLQIMCLRQLQKLRSYTYRFAWWWYNINWRSFRKRGK